MQSQRFHSIKFPKHGTTSYTFFLKKAILYTEIA